LDKTILLLEVVQFHTTVQFRFSQLGGDPMQ